MDFALTSQSPAVDAGLELPSFDETTDLAELVRRVDNADVPDTGTIPVRWTRGQSGYLKDVDSREKAQKLISWHSDEESERPLRLILQTSGGETKRLQVKNCEDYLEARDLHYRPEASEDRSHEHYFRFRCESLRRITEAKPSKVSYLRDYRFHSGSLKELPPCVGAMGGVDGYRTAVERALETLSSWKSFAPDKTVVRAEKEAIVFQDKDETITAEMSVWGDFNGDGIEDVLLLTATQPSGIDGRYKDYSAVALTRFKGESFFRALGELGDWACRPQTSLKVGVCRWDHVDEQRLTFVNAIKAKQYDRALAFWRDVFTKCELLMSEERRLNFLADLSAVANRAGKNEECKNLAQRGLATEATSWTSTQTAIRSLKQNYAICEGQIRFDPKKRPKPNAGVSDEVLQVDEVLYPWEAQERNADPRR